MSGVDNLFEFIIDTAVNFYKKARDFVVAIFSAEPVARYQQRDHRHSFERRNTPDLPPRIFTDPSSPNTPRLPIIPQPARRKKFEIIDTSNPVIPRFYFTDSRRTDKFKNITETMPHQCPFCRTKSEDEPGNIIKADDEWKCKSCDYTW